VADCNGKSRGFWNCILFFSDAGVWSQGRQALYHLSHSTSPQGVSELGKIQLTRFL
jgi:hypothetical protein